jgi:hypothetical protein
MVIPGGIILFGLWGEIGQAKAFAVTIVFGAFYAAISRRWELRHNKYFWISAGLLFAVHLFAIALLSFPKEISPALLSLPFAIVDALAVWKILGLFEEQSV